MGFKIPLFSLLVQRRVGYYYSFNTFVEGVFLVSILLGYRLCFVFEAGWVEIEIKV